MSEFNMDDTTGLAYKAIRFNHSNNQITLIGEYEYSEDGKDAADMDCYMDMCDEPAPDKNFMYSWQVVCTYRFNTTLGAKI